MTTQTTITVEDLDAFMHLQTDFCVKEQIRFYLMGVHIAQRDVGIVCAATDGLKLGIYKDIVSVSGAPLQKEGVIIQVVNPIKRKKGPMNNATFILPKPGKNALFEPIDKSGVPGVVKLIDGDFPAFEKAIPTKNLDVGCFGALNPELLAKFNPKRCGAGVALFQDKNEPKSPILVLNNDDRFTGVLMPVKWHDEPKKMLERSYKGKE